MIGSFKLARNARTWPAIALAFGVPAMAEAQYTTVYGKVVQVQGHANPICRQVFLRKADGTVVAFRAPPSQPGEENAILATALTALTTGYGAQINYNTSVTSGCGGEPAIAWISIHAPGY